MIKQLLLIILTFTFVNLRDYRCGGLLEDNVTYKIVNCYNFFILFQGDKGIVCLIFPSLKSKIVFNPKVDRFEAL